MLLIKTRWKDLDNSYLICEKKYIEELNLSYFCA